MHATPPGRPPEPGAAQDMRLTVWSGPDQSWHARLVLANAIAHEFTSPFELARFLTQLGQKPTARAQGRGGLR